MAGIRCPMCDCDIYDCRCEERYGKPEGMSDVGGEGMKYIGPLYGKVCGKYILLNQEATEHSEVLEVPASISNPVVVDGERLRHAISEMCKGKNMLPNELEDLKAYWLSYLTGEEAPDA